MSAGKWMQGAVKHPGAFTKKANAEGESVAEFAREKAHAAGRLGKQPRLALIFKRVAAKRKGRPLKKTLGSRMGSR